MADERLPRILSPNLGCPQIVSIESLERSGTEIVLADHKANADLGVYEWRAIPSYPGEGRAFSLLLAEPAEVECDELPQNINDVSETRFLVSTTLRSGIFEGGACFWRARIRPQDKLGHEIFRQAQGLPRSTLYDLVLRKGDQSIHEVKHSLCLRPPSPEVRFIHLTDLHVAARNDLLAQEVNSSVNPTLGRAALRVINFNDRLREFIKEANALADSGELDFVLALGDLVDFVKYGFGKSAPGDDNWRVFIEILTGGGDETIRGNPGLRVPVFTTLGNHDWRPNPYPPEFTPKIFGMTGKDLEKFDYLYADTSEVVGAKISEVLSKLVSKGSPILARSWWGSVIGFGLRWWVFGFDRIWTRGLAFAGKNLRKVLIYAIGVAAGIGGVTKPEALQVLIQKYFPEGFSIHAVLLLVCLVGLVWLSAEVLRIITEDWTRGKLLEKITALTSIETQVDGLQPYFLNLNPYFNYAFRLENCYFLILDTGHDALTGESFWDDGGKKLRKLDVRDNIIGGSPETMAFFPPNENYPYSQISWLELVLGCIRRTHNQLAGTDRHCRILVGLHAPPVNLSTKDRKRADTSRGGPAGPILLRRGWPRGFDIHYGTLNHYISEFMYLCLGYRQSALQNPSGPGVDIVLSGHVHWNIEFHLVRPSGPGSAAAWNPQVYYGDFSSEVEQHRGPPNRWWGPFLVQTAACGPPSEADPHTPYFRYITVDQALGIRTLRPTHL